MSRSLITFAALAIAVATTFVNTQAQAVQRTHVSAAFGADSNTATNCTAAAPCRFFAAAMSVTDNNGEVIVLDSGGYGAVTITKSLSLIAPTGVYAGISVFPGTDGVTIATPEVNATLRGITINGQGGNNGIRMTAGRKLSLENCFIANLSVGISVSGNTTVRIADSYIRDNSGSGIMLSDGARATLSRVIASNNVGEGVYALGLNASTTTVDIADSTFDGNAQGVSATSVNANAAVSVSVRESRLSKNNTGIVPLSANTTSGPVKVTVSNNIISHNRFGIFVSNPNAKILASGNTISDNTSHGLVIQSGGIIESAGNNLVRNNAVNILGPLTAVATQ